MERSRTFAFLGIPAVGLLVVYFVAVGRAGEDVRVALVGVGAALVGSVVGGLVTGWVSLTAEDKRQAFAREVESERRNAELERERAVARGAARIWRSRFFSALQIYRVVRDKERWWTGEFVVEPLPPVEERRLVASALTSDEWFALEKAEAALAALGGGPDRAFGPEDLEMVEGVIHLIEEAVRAIAGVANMPPEVRRPPRDQGKNT